MTRRLALLVALATAGAAVTQLTVREIAIALFMLSIGVVLGAVTLVSHLDVDDEPLHPDIDADGMWTGGRR